MFRTCLLFETKPGSFLEQADLKILRIRIFYKALKPLNRDSSYVTLLKSTILHTTFRYVNIPSLFG